MQKKIKELEKQHKIDIQKFKDKEQHHDNKMDILIKDNNRIQNLEKEKKVLQDEVEELEA